MKRTELGVGRRVWLVLPERSGPRRAVLVRAQGTVIGLDEPELPPGVRVQLDREFNGVATCYATYGELHGVPSPPTSELINMYEAGGLTETEIAERTGISQPTVSTRLRDAGVDIDHRRRSRHRRRTS